MKQSAGTRRSPRTNAPDAPDAMFALLGAADALYQRVERAMGEAGLSMAKYGVLQALAEAGEPLTLTELAAGQRCVRSNITQLVDRLEAEGLVKRVDDPADRRTIRASLTPSGKEKAAAGAKALAALQREFASLVSAPDRAAVARMLSALK
ncbi:MAG: MarR family transcriptional regulator [Gemmatimonadaceae bacterium]